MSRSPTVLAVVLAVLTVLTGACAPAPVAGEESERVTSQSLPSPPDGSRWVGMDGVVVAVPDWWTTGETQCLKPVEDTVYFESGAMTDCSDEPDPATLGEVSSLAVIDGASAHGQVSWGEAATVGSANGHDVVERDGCQEWLPGVCRKVFGVPDLDVVFAVTIAEEGDADYEQVRDSVTVLPDGWTTVPLRIAGGWTPAWGDDPRATADLVRAVERAGLRAEVKTLAPTGRDDVGLTADLPQGSLLEVSPSLGSVVEDGATVTISVVG